MWPLRWKQKRHISPTDSGKTFGLRRNHLSKAMSRSKALCKSVLLVLKVLIESQRYEWLGNSTCGKRLRWQFVIAKKMPHAKKMSSANTCDGLTGDCCWTAFETLCVTWTSKDLFVDLLHCRCSFFPFSLASQFLWFNGKGQTVWTLQGSTVRKLRWTKSSLATLIYLAMVPWQPFWLLISWF